MSLALMLALAGGPPASLSCPMGRAALESMRGRALQGAGVNAVESVRIAELAASGDLGFSLLRWQDVRAQAPVELVAVWKRTVECDWEVAATGRAVTQSGIRTEDPVPVASSKSTGKSPDGQPSPALLEKDAAGLAIDAFELVAEQDGVAPALHVYALDFDRGFHLSIDEAPLAEGVGGASSYLSARPLPGYWRDRARERSIDGTLIYAAGSLEHPLGVLVRRYLQIWQYDPKVANFGLRVLWMSAPLK
jgi:hypothetical protein